MPNKSLTELIQLDPNITATWLRYMLLVRAAITDEQKRADALSLIHHVQTHIPRYVYLSPNTKNFALYAVALLEQIDTLLGQAWIAQMHHYGYSTMYRLIHDIDETNPDVLFASIYANTHYQFLLKQPNPVKDEWETDLKDLPFCWVEKVTLGKVKQRCVYSKKKLMKGDQVYRLLFFPFTNVDFYYADIDAFHTELKAVQNFAKYQNDAYELSDFDYDHSLMHPCIKAFWYDLAEFDLHKTLDMIARPPVLPTYFAINTLKYLDTDLIEENPLPFKELTRDEFIAWHNGEAHFSKSQIGGVMNQPEFVSYSSGQWGDSRIINQDENPQRKCFQYPTILSGDGGDFVDLLYVLVKCGYWNEILAYAPQLPKYFTVMLLCFNHPERRTQVAQLLNIPELPEIYELALRNYSQKSEADVRRIMEFAQNHPEFIEQLGIALNVYEYHLYSNYSPRVNWFFQEFGDLVLGRGGGLLDFFIGAPSKLPLLQQMIAHNGVPDAHLDAMDNMLPVLYRVTILNLYLSDSPNLQIWLDSAEEVCESEGRSRFYATHQKTLKLMAYFKKNKWGV